jgi:hypothetical protein
MSDLRNIYYTQEFHIREDNKCFTKPVLLQSLQLHNCSSDCLNISQCYQVGLHGPFSQIYSKNLNCLFHNLDLTKNESLRDDAQVTNSNKHKYHSQTSSQHIFKRRPIPKIITTYLKIKKIKKNIHENNNYLPKNLKNLKKHTRALVPAACRPSQRYSRSFSR